MRSKFILAAIAAIAVFAPALRAQSYTSAKFKAGDSPEWKTPAFDDSSWQTLQLNKVWDDQGIPEST